jgi:hypothetical protein
MARWFGLLVWLVGCYGFMPNLVSPLEALVSIRALGSAVGSTVAAELITDNPLFIDVMHGRFHPEQDVLYVALAFVALCSKVGGAVVDEDRWSAIDRYADVRKRTNMFLLVFAIVLTKNIENAI